MKEFSLGDKKIAAFFDLDGTLTAGSSLEWKYFLNIRARRMIAAKNYWLWLAHAMRLAPRGLAQMRHANKMYLRGVATDLRCPIPTFLPQALQQVAWHARQGHLIVIITGSLEPLAKDVARRIGNELAKRGIKSAIQIVATQLEECAGTWTGRIIGPARIGAAKAESLRSLARELNLDLSRCYAYGNTESDVPMLEAVGKPATVNASLDLRDVARRQGWPEILWKKEGSLDGSAKETQPRNGGAETAEKLA
ncbi:MAG TPA: HAD family hydrolase [Candidatus Dormibacteraeota bacterium]|nr:HAD family hydrolase [Candidatus Dormibacteraeota bacterium]